MAKRKCSVCDTAVDTENLHPDSLEIPKDGEYAVLHMGCANGEDRYNGANPTDEELKDSRAWVIQR